METVRFTSNGDKILNGYIQNLLHDIFSLAALAIINIPGHSAYDSLEAKGIHEPILGRGELIEPQKVPTLLVPPVPNPVRGKLLCSQTLDRLLGHSSLPSGSPTASLSQGQTDISVMVYMFGHWTETFPCRQATSSRVAKIP